MNRTLTLIAAKVVLGGSLALGFAIAPHAFAHANAAPHGVDVYEKSVNLSDLPTIDSMPVCHMEDGSDADPAALPCIWTNSYFR